MSGMAWGRSTASCRFPAWLLICLSFTLPARPNDCGMRWVDGPKIMEASEDTCEGQMDAATFFDSALAAAGVATIAALGGAAVGAWWTSRSAENTAAKDRVHASLEARLEREHAAEQARLERQHASEQAREDRLAAKRQEAFSAFEKWAQDYAGAASRQYAAVEDNEDPPWPDDAALDAIAASLRLLGSPRTVAALEDLLSLLWNCREQGRFDWDDADQTTTLCRAVEDRMRADLGTDPLRNGQD